jgi:hypothetical protein
MVEESLEETAGRYWGILTFYAEALLAIKEGESFAGVNDPREIAKLALKPDD